MDNLNQELVKLFQISDSLLLLDEASLEEISRKQRSLRTLNEDIVLQGLITMRELLQDLADHSKTLLVNSMEEVDWIFIESFESGDLITRPTSPSIWELSRHLSNWILVFIPPVQALNISGDMELVSCLESKDDYVSTLAAIMLGHAEFSYLGSMEEFRKILNTARQTSLRLETCRILYTRYHDLEALRNECVPNLIASEDQYDIILEGDVQRKRFLSFIRELVVWDIATKGEGPSRKWATWWT